MDVSVIIVNYNTRELTTNCIRSVFDSQTRYSFEVILVDNGSSDDSVRSVRTLFPDVKIIENSENVGFAAANNKAAKTAAGRYLYILNSDTEIEKDVIEKAVSYGDANRKVGVIGTKVVFPNGDLYVNFYRFQTFLSELIFFTFGIIKSNDYFLFHLNKYRNYSLSEPFEVDVVSGCSLIIKRNVYENIGLFNERFFMYYEDGEFCYRVKKNGFKRIYLPTVSIKHIHKGSAKNDENFRILISCFESACCYIGCINSGFSARIFRYMCFFSWFNTLLLFKVLSVPSDNAKLKRKINMLKALLAGKGKKI